MKTNTSSKTQQSAEKETLMRAIKCLKMADKVVAYIETLQQPETQQVTQLLTNKVVINKNTETTETQQVIQLPANQKLINQMPMYQQVIKIPKKTPQCVDNQRVVSSTPDNSSSLNRCNELVINELRGEPIVIWIWRGRDGRWRGLYRGVLCVIDRGDIYNLGDSGSKKVMCRYRVKEVRGIKMLIVNIISEVE